MEAFDFAVGLRPVGLDQFVGCAECAAFVGSLLCRLGQARLTPTASETPQDPAGPGTRVRSL